MTSLPVLLQTGEHVCAFYNSDEEQRAILVPFLCQGLEEGQRIICVVDATTPGTVLDWLRAAGVDMTAALASERLVVLTRESAYLRGGGFDPDRMLALLQAETAQCLAAGYTALRLAGEMSWALRGLPGSERLLEYEARLDEFLRGNACLVLCQYDLRRFQAEMALDVLHIHPVLCAGGEVFQDNFYYVPPSELLGADSAAAILRRRLQSLTMHNRADQRRRESEACARALLQASGDAVIVLDTEGVILNTSDIAARRLGRAANELIGMRLWELWPAETAAAYRECAEAACALGRMEQLDYPGGGIWSRARFYPVPAVAGQVAQVVLVAGDDDGRRRLAAALKESGACARRALAEMRLLLYGLRSPAPAQAGLTAALLGRLEAVEQRAGIRTRLALGPVGVLPPAVEETVYAVAIEALNDVLRRAAAEVSVRLARSNNRLALEVVDEGGNFRSPADGEGRGVWLMRESVRQAGGRLEITPALPRGEHTRSGVCVRLDIDLHTAARLWHAEAAPPEALPPPEPAPAIGSVESIAA